MISWAPKVDRIAPEIVFDHLQEGIGIALDIPGDRMFLTDLAGGGCALTEAIVQIKPALAEGGNQ